MGEFAEMIMSGIFCEGCGEFINAEPAGHPQKCDDCFDDEMVEAVEKNEWPDGMTHGEWSEIRRWLSEPDVRE